MKVSEAIDRLKVGDTVWVKGRVEYIDELKSLPLNVEFAETIKYISGDDEISLTEPKNEKVEVPDYIAKLIRKYKERNGTLFCSIADLYNGSDEYKWYVDNAEIYERAWVNGYTFKPKLYIVKNWCGEVFSGFYGGYSVSPRFTTEERYYCDFNVRAKAEAVATLVEGSVEEV